MADSISKWTTLGAAMAGLAVVTGAFGAHGMDRYCAEKYADGGTKSIAGHQVPLSWKRLQDFKTAAEYHMYHGLGLLAVGLLAQRQRRKSLEAAGWAFLGGIVLFSGSLYLLTLTGRTWWGAVTPLGGTLFIIGWTALAAGACGCAKTTEKNETTG